MRGWWDVAGLQYGGLYLCLKQCSRPRGAMPLQFWLTLHFLPAGGLMPPREKRQCLPRFCSAGRRRRTRAAAATAGASREQGSLRFAACLA